MKDEKRTVLADDAEFFVGVHFSDVNEKRISPMADNLSSPSKEERDEDQQLLFFFWLF